MLTVHDITVIYRTITVAVFLLCYPICEIFARACNPSIIAFRDQIKAILIALRGNEKTVLDAEYRSPTIEDVIRLLLSAHSLSGFHFGTPFD